MTDENGAGAIDLSQRELCIVKREEVKKKKTELGDKTWEPHVRQHQRELQRELKEETIKLSALQVKKGWQSVTCERADAYVISSRYTLVDYFIDFKGLKYYKSYEVDTLKVQTVV